MPDSKVEVQLPKDLGLTRSQVSELQKSFEKQLADMLKAKPAKAKPDKVAIRAKVKNEVV